MWEADEGKGGASLAKLSEEAEEGCEEVVEEYPQYRGHREVLEKVFDHDDNPPIVWVRVQDFQNESLKLIALRVLRQLPGTAAELLHGPQWHHGRRVCRRHRQP